MSQTTLDDELFDEAAAEVRKDVETNLERARDQLPTVADIWEVEADNTLGVLNALRSALVIDEAQGYLRDAKKWYTMGERADAFEDGDDLQEEIEAVEELLGQFADAREAVGELTTTLPELRSTLAEIQEEGGE